MGRAAGRKIDKLGLQLYTVRTEMEKDFEGTLAKVAAAGYQEVEFAGYFNQDPKKVRAILDRHKPRRPLSPYRLRDGRDEACPGD